MEIPSGIWNFGLGSSGVVGNLKLKFSCIACQICTRYWGKLANNRRPEHWTRKIFIETPPQALQPTTLLCLHIAGQPWYASYAATFGHAKPWEALCLLRAILDMVDAVQRSIFGNRHVPKWQRAFGILFLSVHSEEECWRWCEVGKGDYIANPIFGTWMQMTGFAVPCTNAQAYCMISRAWFVLESTCLNVSLNLHDQSEPQAP